MSAQELAPALRQALIALGVLFVIVDLKVGAQIFGWWRRRLKAVVTWPGPKPPFYTINLLIGVLLGVLLFFTAYVEITRLHRGWGAAPALFGVGMMFIYYGYLLPLSVRMRRGLYHDGIWTDSGFMHLHRDRRPHLEGRRHARARLEAQDAGAAPARPRRSPRGSQALPEGKDRRSRDRVRRRAWFTSRHPGYKGIRIEAGGAEGLAY